MRREPTELPFTGRSWGDDHATAQVPDPDRQVSYSAGRAYLNESTVRVPKYGVTPDDLKAMRERSAEEADHRQARETANLAAALRLGAALKVLKGEN